MQEAKRIESIPILDREEVKQKVERARARFDDLDAQARRAVQDRPVVAVAAALVLGYALGRLLARR